MQLTINLRLLADQANALAKHHAGCGEQWYEGLMNMLCEIEYALQKHGEVMIVTTESK